MMLYAHALHFFCIFTMFHAFRCVFYMLEPCVLVGLDWADPMMKSLLHISWSCIIHAYIPFISSLVHSINWCFSVCLPFPFFLSRIVYAWQPSVKLLHPETLFVSGHILLIPHLSIQVPWWESPLGLLGELLQMWHSFETPRYLIRLLWYYSSDCYKQAGLGISLWDTHEFSLRDYTGVLLQYAQFWLFYTLFHYFCSRYSYSSYLGAYLQYATCSEGIAS